MTFILSATWCKLGNKTTLFGMNIVTRMILLGLIAILGTRAADYVILLGMLSELTSITLSDSNPLDLSLSLNPL